MNEVERLIPCLFFEYIAYFEDAIWSHPGHTGREQIHSANRCCRASVSLWLKTVPIIRLPVA